MITIENQLQTIQFTLKSKKRLSKNELKIFFSDQSNFSEFQNIQKKFNHNLEIVDSYIDGDFFYYIILFEI